MAKSHDKRAPSPAPEDEHETEGPSSKTLMDAYTRCRPLVDKLAPEEIIPYRGDAQTALFNYRRGLDAIRPGEARLRAEVPGISFESVALGLDLGHGLIFADGRVAREPSIDNREVSARVARLRELRDLLLETAETLAKRGLLPMQRVRAIRSGTGNYDAARDGVDLHGLFTEFAAQITGKHSFTTAEIDEVGELGSWLVSRLAPPGSKPVKENVPTEAEDLRDRFWTLFQRCAVDLRKLGYYLFGDDFDAHTPPLMSRRRKRHGSIEEPAPTSGTETLTEAGESE